VAITATELTTNGSTSNLSVYTATLSRAIAANTLCLAWVGCTGTATLTANATVTGGNVTWDPIVFQAFNTTTTNLSRFTLYRAMGAAPSGTSITITFNAGRTGALWSFIEFAGVDTSGTNGSGAIRNNDPAAGNGITTLNGSLVLPAFGSVNNATAAGFMLDTTGTITPEGGWTAFTASSHSNPTEAIRTQWIAANDTSPSASWVTADAAGIAVEIVAEVVAPPVDMNPEHYRIIALQAVHRAASW
jgi:hypothetical protein